MVVDFISMDAKNLRQDFMLKTHSLKTEDVL